MSKIQMCADPKLQAKFYQYSIKRPESCSSVSEKISDLQNRLKALESERRKLLAKNSWNVFLTEGLLWTSLVAKTSYAFVDLAGSVGQVILPPVLGEKVATASSVATNMMDIADTSGNYFVGNTSMREATIQNVGHMSNILISTIPSGADKDLRQYGADKTTAMYNFLNSSYNGNTNDSKSATIDIGFSNLNYAISSLDTHGVPAARQIQGAIGTVRSAQKYSNALEKIFNEHLSNKEWTERERKEINKFIDRKMVDIEKKLDQALAQLKGCL